jgi:hypothetical protein
MLVKGVSLAGSHACRDGWIELTPLRIERDRAILNANFARLLSRSIEGGAAQR